MSDLWKLSVPWWEFVLRGVVVYLFLLVLLRLTGKRQIGQLSPFDLVLLLVLSNAVQNSMNAGDNSLLGGLISATTLVVLNYIVGWATYKSKNLEFLLEGHPLVLIHHGEVKEHVLESVQITHHELQAALRRCGCASVDEVQVAVLENNGDVTVIRKTNRDGS